MCFPELTAAFSTFLMAIHLIPPTGLAGRLAARVMSTATGLMI